MAMQSLVSMHAEAMRTLDSVFTTACLDAIHEYAAIHELVGVLRDLKDGTITLDEVDLSEVPAELLTDDVATSERKGSLKFTAKIVKDFVIPDGITEAPPAIDVDALQKDRGLHVKAG